MRQLSWYDFGLLAVVVLWTGMLTLPPVLAFFSAGLSRLRILVHAAKAEFLAERGKKVDLGVTSLVHLQRSSIEKDEWDECWRKMQQVAARDDDTSVALVADKLEEATRMVWTRASVATRIEMVKALSAVLREQDSRRQTSVA